MSKLPFEISASFKSAKFNRHMVSSSIEIKREFPFARIVILAMSVTFLSVIAIGSVFAHDMADSFIDQHGAKVRIAADDPLYCVSM